MDRSFLKAKAPRWTGPPILGMKENCQSVWAGRMMDAAIRSAQSKPSTLKPLWKVSTPDQTGKSDFQHHTAKSLRVALGAKGVQFREAWGMSAGVGLALKGGADA